ncbi:probable methyltransferase-like protein 24 [Haliotis asinina]|uniref:probable methyltransferase-like protein 24 n=1 Tax=Haliotis asinina TaxID=109174 RepID=UPI00353192C8
MQRQRTFLLVICVIFTGFLCVNNEVKSSVNDVVKMVQSTQKVGIKQMQVQVNSLNEDRHDAPVPQIYDNEVAIPRNQQNVVSVGLLQVVLPTKYEIERMSDEEAFRTYHSYLDNTDTICHRKLRMGNIGDGGWEICDYKQYRPVKPCIVYSFGINNEFSFDDDTAKSYECDVFSFDPSMMQTSYKRSNHVQFLKMGISGTDTDRGGWELHTLKTFKKMLNHTGKVIDVLKADVEGSEWPSLPEMTSSGELMHVKQLLLEYHGDCSDRRQCTSRLKTLKDIHDIGFRRFYVHKNPACKLIKSALFPVIRTRCYEVHYVNINAVRP